MSRKIIYILIGLAVAGMVYHYIRKKKSAVPAGAPFIPASPANVAETARSLSLSEEDAVEVDDRRTYITEVNAVNANPDFKPVVTVAETLTFVSKKIPVLDTSDELAADGYAFKKLAGEMPGSLRGTVHALIDVLPGDTTEQHKRSYSPYCFFVNK